MHVNSSRLVSLIIPVLDEEEVIPHLLKRLDHLALSIKYQLEIIFIDDGSTDRSAELLRAECKRDRRIKLIEFSRNFGHQVAISAGIDYARGDAIVIMDADLQDPPEVVVEMIAKWEEGYEVVYGVRTSRHNESWIKRATAATFYRLLRHLVPIRMPNDAGDFRLVDRKAVNAFKRLGEKSRYVRGLFSWIGFKQVGVNFDRPSRQLGESKYPFAKMLKLAIDGVVGFSGAPLRLVLKIGFMMAALSFVGGLSAVVLKLTGYYTVRGWTSLMLFISFTSGFQLMVLGMLGEYLVRIADEVRGRPLYLVREETNVSQPNIERQVS